MCYGVFVLGLFEKTLQEWGCIGALGRISEFESVNQTIILLLLYYVLLYYYYEKKQQKQHLSYSSDFSCPSAGR